MPCCNREVIAWIMKGFQVDLDLDRYLPIPEALVKWCTKPVQPSYSDAQKPYAIACHVLFLSIYPLVCRVLLTTGARALAVPEWCKDRITGQSWSSERGTTWGPINAQLPQFRAAAAKNGTNANSRAAAAKNAQATIGKNAVGRFKLQCTLCRKMCATLLHCCIVAFFWIAWLHFSAVLRTCW